MHKYEQLDNYSSESTSSIKTRPSLATILRNVPELAPVYMPPKNLKHKKATPTEKETAPPPTPPNPPLSEPSFGGLGLPICSTDKVEHGGNNMAYLEDLINQIDDETLKQNILKEVRGLKSSKKFGLVWEKSKENLSDTLKTMLPYPIQDPTLSVTKPVPAGENPPPPHLLFEGDNLLALLALQATHANKVDVIYIDPPYNTGKEFVYNDKIVDSEDYHRHSKWLSFMDTRLRLAKNLLKDTGVIFISIDDNEQANLKLLCDEIFGEHNFIATASWQGFATVKNSAKVVSKNCEYVLIYAASAECVAFTGVPKGHEQAKRYKNPASDPRGPYKLTPLHVMAGTKTDNREPRTFSNGQTWQPPEGSAWRFSAEALVALDKDDRLDLDPAGKKAPNRRTYWSEVSSRMPLSTFWKNEDWGNTMLSNQELGDLLGKGAFSFPKPTKLLTRLLDATAPSNALVLDFFAGSGTTGHAVAQLNAEDGGTRQVILVTDNSGKVENGGFVSDAGTEGICRKVTFPRMQAVLTGVWADGKPHDALPGELRGFVMGGVERVESGEEQRKNVIGVADSFISLKTNMYNVASDSVLEGLNFFDDISEELLDAYDDEAFDIYIDRNLRTYTDEKNKSSGVNSLDIPVTVVWRDENVNPALIKELCETVEKVFNPPTDSKFLYVGVLSGVGEDYIATELGDILPSWGVYGFGENFIAPMLRGLKEIE